MSEHEAIFGGEVFSSIDAKGRTSIPAKFREALLASFGDERFVITKAHSIRLADGSYARGLSVYPINGWTKIKHNILTNAGGYSSQQLDSVKRQLLNPAEECGTDKLGRVLIPPSLREHARLESKLWFVGMGQRFDIWSKDSYDRVNDQDERNMPEDLTAIGL